MKTTLEEIRKHHPCESGWKKLITTLGRTIGEVTFAQILESNRIEDAVWCLKVIPYIDRCLFSADIAESVLLIFENKHPDDKRPREAIESIRKFHSGKISKKDLAYAAYAAYAAAADAAAYAYADAAAYAAYAAAAAAADAAYAATRQKKWNEIKQLFIKYFITK